MYELAEVFMCSVFLWLYTDFSPHLLTLAHALSPDCAQLPSVQALLDQIDVALELFILLDHAGDLREGMHCGGMISPT